MCKAVWILSTFWMNVNYMHIQWSSIQFILQHVPNYVCSSYKPWTVSLKLLMYTVLLRSLHLRSSIPDVSFPLIVSSPTNSFSPRFLTVYWGYSVRVSFTYHNGYGTMPWHVIKIVVLCATCTEVVRDAGGSSRRTPASIESKFCRQSRSNTILQFT